MPIEKVVPLPAFLCPLCGSNKCVFVVYRSPAGKMTRMPWFRCAGCTVMFEDARRFSTMMRHTYADPLGGEYPRVEEVVGIGMTNQRHKTITKLWTKVGRENG